MAIEEIRKLPSGRTVSLRMPDLYRLLNTAKGIPNPALAAVLKLLSGEGNNGEVINELQRLQNQKAQIRGLYEIARLCLVSPVLRLDLEEGATLGEGEIGPDEIPMGDLEVIYFGFFRLGTRSGFGPATNNPQPIENIGSDGESVSLSTESTDGDIFG